MNEPELTLRPSQWINSGWILFGLVGIPFVIPTLIALFKMLETYCHRYDFYEDHILESKGIFSVTRNETHYYRIKSILMEEPFLYRVVDIYNIHIRTSDQYNQDVLLHAVPVGKTLVDDLKRVVKLERKQHNVREFDMYEL